MCKSVVEELIASLPCFRPPKVPKLTIKAPAREERVKRKKKKRKRDKEEKQRVPKIKIKLPAQDSKPAAPPPPIKLKLPAQDNNPTAPPPPPIKLKINLPLKDLPTEKGIKLKLAKCPECHKVSVLCACAKEREKKQKEILVFPARKVKPGPKSRGVTPTISSSSSTTAHPSIANTVATAAAAAVASITSFSPSRAMTPPLCPRKSLSPCPPERRRSLSSRKEKWVFDSRPPQQQQQQQQVIVKNPPVFARKSRAVSVEKQVARVSAEAPTAAPSLPEKPKATTVFKAKRPDLLQNTMQAIELERMGDLKSSRKVFNVIDSLFVETFKDDKNGGADGRMREVSIIAYLPQPESHRVVSQILDGVIDGVASKPSAETTLNTPPKRRPSKRSSSSEAFSRSGYVSKRRRMLARRRSAESLTLAASEPRIIASEIVGDLVSDSVSKAEASKAVPTSPSSPTTKRRPRPAKTGAEAFSRQSYSKKRR